MYSPRHLFIEPEPRLQQRVTTAPSLCPSSSLGCADDGGDDDGDDGGDGGVRGVGTSHHHHPSRMENLRSGSVREGRRWPPSPPPPPQKTKKTRGGMGAGLLLRLAARAGVRAGRTRGLAAGGRGPRLAGKVAVVTGAAG